MWVLRRHCTCSQEAPEHRQIPEALQIALREWARGEGIQEARAAQSWKEPQETVQYSLDIFQWSPKAKGSWPGWTRSRLLAHKQNTQKVILPCWHL